jgi:hypothetical protein
MGCMLNIRAGLAVLVCLSAFPISAADLTSSIADPATWRSEEFLAQWPRKGVDDDSAFVRTQLPQGAELFGLKPAVISARWLKGEVHSVSVIFLDAGYFFGYQNSNLPKGVTLESAKTTFDQTFVSARQAIIEGLSKLGGGSGTDLELGTRSGLKMKTKLFSTTKVHARLLSYEHQLLAVDFFRSDAEARTLHVSIAPKAKENALLATRAPASGNPEHRLSLVPMIPQGNRGYCGVAILAMAGSWLGLQPGAEEYAAINGFQYGADRNPDIRELFGAVAREAGVKAQRSPKFEVSHMRQSIDAGMPVVVFRWWSQERDYLHSLHSSKIASGQKSELPVPGSEDRKTWPGKKGYAHASIINGYRDDRHEVIFTESWGEQARNRRMRVEEMEGTSYYAVYFLP